MFCSACGSAPADQQSFCVKCGTPVEGASRSGAAASSPAPSVPGSPSAAGPARTGGGSFAKVLLIVLAVVIGMIALSMGTCLYVAYRAKRSFERRVAISKDGSSLTVRTDQGPVTLQSSPDAAAKNATLDIPLYPGATPVEGSSATLSFGGKGGVTGLEYETADALEKVVAFYAEKFSPSYSTEEGRVQFMRMDGSGMRSVTVSRAQGKTRISIAKIGK